MTEFSLANGPNSRLRGTDLCGAAVVQTRDPGVLFERITYFDRNIRYPLSMLADIKLQLNL